MCEGSHSKNYHSTIPASCNECGKTFRNQYVLKGHMYYGHKTETPCTVCGKLVKQQDDHMRSWHTDLSDKRYKCDQCGKGFMDRTRFKQHTDIHLNLRQHKCRAGCDIGFNDQNNRNQHEKRVHRYTKSELQDQQ